MDAFDPRLDGERQPSPNPSQLGLEFQKCTNVDEVAIENTLAMESSDPVLVSFIFRSSWQASRLFNESLLRFRTGSSPNLSSNTFTRGL
jgi:hypothetical protein